MQFDSTDTPLAEIQTPCLAVPLAVASALDEQIAPRGYLRSALRHAKDEAGEVTCIAMPEGAGAEQLIAFGVGEVVTLKEVRKIGVAVGKAIKACEVTSATVVSARHSRANSATCPAMNAHQTTCSPRPSAFPRPTTFNAPTWTRAKCKRAAWAPSSRSVVAVRAKAA